jgi:hypothetical protein
MILFSYKILNIIYFKYQFCFYQSSDKVLIWKNCVRIVLFDAKNGKIIKVSIKQICIVNSIELYQLCIYQIFSQLSVFSFQKKNRVLLKKCIVYKIFWHNKTHHFRHILTKWQFIHSYQRCPSRLNICRCRAATANKKLRPRRDGNKKKRWTATVTLKISGFLSLWLI